MTAINNHIPAIPPPPLLPNENALFQRHQRHVSKAMSSNNDQWANIDEKVKLNRFRLNQEFYAKALIHNQVFYCWYPGRNIVSGHAHLETVDRECIAAMGTMDLFKARKMVPDKYRGQPQVRFSLKVTPQELDNLNGYLNKRRFLFPSTCSGNTASILAHTIGINIPFPLSLSPLLSGSYLYLRKTIGWNRVGDINFFSKPSTLTYIPLITGTLVEFGLVSVVAITAATAIANRFSNLLKT